MEEEWRPIKGTDNNYYVSNLGHVKSVDRVVHYPDGKMRCFPGKLLTPVEMPNGYLRVHIRKPINKKPFFFKFCFIARHNCPKTRKFKNLYLYLIFD